MKPWRSLSESASAEPPSSLAFMRPSFMAGGASSSNHRPTVSVSNLWPTKNARLKRLLAEQAEELAIVKKAAAYFAKSLK